MNSVEFSDWITRKFIEWRGDRIGKTASVAEFAKKFGAPQQLMSDWMKKGGKVPRSAKYIHALVSIYGEEVYDILGLPRPFGMSIDFSEASPFTRDLKAALVESGEVIRSRGIEADSPQAVDIFIEIFSKHGFNHSSTTNSPPE